MSERHRAYAYRVSVAIVPLLVLYGFITEEAAPLWVGLLAAVLGAGPSALATKHTSTRRG